MLTLGGAHGPDSDTCGSEAHCYLGQMISSYDTSYLTDLVFATLVTLEWFGRLIKFIVSE